MLTKLPFNVMEKDYQKVKTIIPLDNGLLVEGWAYVDNNGNIIKLYALDNKWHVYTIPNNEKHNTYLLLHAVLKGLPNKANIIQDNPTFNEDVFTFTNKGVLTNINSSEDIRFYLQSLDLSVDDIGNYNNLEDLGNLIRVVTKMGELPSEFLYLKDMVDAHNLYFRKRDGTRDSRKDKLKRNALYNFISLKTKNISKDPINLIQGQSGIDVATDTVKSLVKIGGDFDRLSSMPVTSDNRSILARMHLLVLTLTGKENVGIVASAMKVFEAMNHHYNKVLSEGTPEELKRLLSKFSILGRRLPLVANSYTKNKDSIYSNKTLEAFKSVNNFEDAFIMMSALLSLATD